MQLTIHKPNLRRDRSERRLTEPCHVVSAADARARRSAAVQDEALYRCPCGCAFKAEVTTSVGCPHCGTGQAW